jgi:branched-chain amino acid transport system substrate-binding protein
MKENTMSTRRHFITQTAAGASALAFPLVGGAQARAIKVGVLHPVTGALAYSGQQCRLGAELAIEDINRTGIKSLGGAKIEPLLADAQSTPQAGVAEIEKINEAGASAVVGAFASAWPPPRPLPSTTCRTWWTWAWPTRSSSVV